MSSAPTVHVVASARTSLLAGLEQRLEGHAHVQQHAGLPSPKAVRSTDILVINLDDAAESPDAATLLPLLTRLEVWLVAGERAVSPGWLEAVRWPGVKLTHNAATGAEEGGGVDAVATALLRRIAGPSGTEIAALVLAREPGLVEVAPMVRVLCERAWEVRHPKQLAAALGTRLTTVKRTLVDLGFERVEHLMTYVRWVAFEQIMAVHRLRAPLASRLAGITDLSNMRRQMSRARRGSARALRRLKAG
jgi:hypothetical protein